MKNRVAIALITALVAANISACASGTAQQGAAEPAEAAQEAEEAAEEAAEETAEAPAEETEEAEVAAEETAEAPAEEEAASAETTESGETASVRPVYTIMSYNFMEEMNDTVIATGSYEVVKLTEEAVIEYPQLNKMLEAANGDIVEKFKDGFDEIKDASKSYCEDNDMDPIDFPQGVSEAKITPVRCDGSVVSFYETGYTNYPGAAHGFTGYQTYNFDTVSGNEIGLADVFADKEALYTAVKENLVAAGDGSQVMGDDVDEQLLYSFGEGSDDLDWVLDPEGVTFLFAPYEIAPYAVGTVEAKISFAAYPDLFTDKYAPAEGGYVKKLDPYTAAKVDIDGDGTEETIVVNGVYEGEGEYLSCIGLKVEIGDQSCTTEDYFYNFNPYFVRDDDGNCFIYVITTTDNDYQKLTVFAINDNVPSVAGTMEGTGTAFSFHMNNEDENEADSYSESKALIDPSSFALATRMDLMSTYSAYRYYKVGEGGMPEPLTDYYVIETDYVLTSLVSLTAEKVDAETGEATGEEVEIPAGTKCTFWHTNGEDTVDLMLEDGSAVRVRVVNEGWPQTVNGIELDAAFEGTVFAG